MASLDKRVGGVTIQPPSKFNNQASSKIQIVFSFPILHLEPRVIKFLDLRILFQANDPNDKKWNNLGNIFLLKLDKIENLCLESVSTLVLPTLLH